MSKKDKKKQDVKQVVKPKKVSNPTGKGGFQDNPHLINKKGRPKRNWTWASLIEQVSEEIDEDSGLTVKQAVTRKLAALALSGNMNAIKEVMNRTDGLPTVKLEVDDKTKYDKEEIRRQLRAAGIDPESIKRASRAKNSAS